MNSRGLSLVARPWGIIRVPIFPANKVTQRSAKSPRCLNRNSSLHMRRHTKEVCRPCLDQIKGNLEGRVLLAKPLNLCRKGPVLISRCTGSRLEDQNGGDTISCSERNELLHCDVEIGASGPLVDEERQVALDW